MAKYLCHYNPRLVLVRFVRYVFYSALRKDTRSFTATLCHAATTIVLNVAFATASDIAGNIFTATSGRWITTVYSMTLVTNLSASCTVQFIIDFPWLNLMN